MSERMTTPTGEKIDIIRTETGTIIQVLKFPRSTFLVTIKNRPSSVGLEQVNGTDVESPASSAAEVEEEKQS